MTTEQASYTLDNTWEKARERLALIEVQYDPRTTARLTALGVGAGWRCLELGAGGGSIARWLCDRVGPAGSVTAVDLEPRFLEADPRPNLEIVQRDIVADGVPGAGYDLIHARALLMHLPDPERLIADLVDRLRPGGVILLEEGDLTSLRVAASPLYTEVWDQSASVAAKAGGDFYWARRLPACLAELGLVDVIASCEAFIYRGGDPWAHLSAMTWEQLTPLMVANGYGADLIAAAIAEQTDATLWFPSVELIAASGRRP